MVSIGHPGFYSSVGFVYAATSEVWDRMQCATTTDSSSTLRACCTCNEKRFCPFPNGGQLGVNDSGYCHGPCGRGDQQCKQLAAGCGVSVVDASRNWGAQQCSESAIAHGQCNLCRHPLWCDDKNGFGFNGAIKTDDDWWNMFGNSDGGAYKGSRQCSWKPSQKQQFVATVRRRAIEQQRRGFDIDAPGGWNEVNMYVGPNDNDAAGVMWSNLKGLMFVRGGGDEDPQNSFGTELDRTRLRQIRDHWRGYGVEVPIFELTMEHWSKYDHWNANSPIILSNEPFSLEYMEPPRE